jgi:chromosome segregation protein
VLERLNEKMKDLKQDRSKLQQTINLVTREKENLENSVKELKTKIKELTQKLQNMESKLGNTTNKLKENEMELGKRADIILKLNDKISKLTEEKNTLTKLLQEKQASFKEKEKVSLELTEKIAVLQGKLSAQNKNFKKLVGENKYLKNELTNYKNRYRALSAILKDIDSLNKRLEEKLKNITNSLKSEKLPMKGEKEIVDLGKMDIGIKENKKKMELYSLIYQAQQKRKGSLANNEKKKWRMEEATAHYNLGLYLIEEARYNEAEEEFHRALELNPSDYDSCFNLGVLYQFYLREPKEAIRFYHRYLELNPKASDKKTVEGWLKKLEK